MKIVIGFIVFVGFLLFIGRTEITTSPFCIRMPGWQNVIGWMFVLAGIGFLCNDAREQAYEKGIDDGIAGMKERIEKYLQGKEGES